MGQISQYCIVRSQMGVNLNYPETILAYTDGLRLVDSQRPHRFRNVYKSILVPFKQIQIMNMRIQFVLRCWCALYKVLLPRRLHFLGIYLLLLRIKTDIRNKLWLGKQKDITLHLSLTETIRNYFNLNLRLVRWSAASLGQFVFYLGYWKHVVVDLAHAYELMGR